MIDCSAPLAIYRKHITRAIGFPFWDATGIFRLTVTVQVDRTTNAKIRRAIRQKVRDWYTHARLVSVGRRTEIGQGYYDFTTKLVVRVVNDRRLP